MSDDKRKRNGLWLRATLGTLLLLGVYVGGYFAISTRSPAYNLVICKFDSKDGCRIYCPLGWLECNLRKQYVEFRNPNDSVFYTFTP